MLAGFGSARRFVRVIRNNHLKDLAVLAVFLVVATGAYFLRGESEPIAVSGVSEIAMVGGPEIAWGNRDAKQVIFTFDGGAEAESGEAILSALKRHGVIGTFFLTGKFAEENPELVKKMAREGHEIWNHTYSHPNLTSLSDEEIKNELAGADAVIQNLTGKTTKPYFRAPYGARNERVLKVAASAGYTSVYWTADVLDWKESEGFTAEQAKARIFANLEPGALYLMHVGDGITGAILGEVLTEAEARGYSLTSLTSTSNIARASASK